MRNLNSNRKLEGKTIVITGASSGVGRATALEFAKYKTKLVLAARRSHTLNEVEAECRQMGSVAIAVTTDVTDTSEVAQLANIANNFGGSIDVWINNAGVLAAGPFEETPVEVHDQVINTNLHGYVHGAHAVLPYFKAQGYGLLINNISMGGWFPTPYAVGYSASKFGLRGFSEALRGELLPWPKIRVCDLFPSFLDTPGIQHAANYTGRYLKPAPPVSDPQKVAKAIVSIVQCPQKSKTIGLPAYFLRAAHTFFPGISRFVTAKVINTYFKTAESSPVTNGNVFEPVEYGASVYGGWNLPSSNKQKLLKTTLIAAVITSCLLIGMKKIK
jgi:short-subunit dehydrogenase